MREKLKWVVKFTVVFVMVTSFLMDACIGAEVTSPTLQLTCVTNKTSYYEYEPVFVTLSIKNISEQEIKVIEPMPGLQVVKISIDSEEVDVSNIPALRWRPARLPDGCEVTLGPGEAVDVKWSLFAQYIYGLPPGKYVLNARYSTLSARKGINAWRGELVSAPVSFEVIKAPKVDSIATEKFGMALQYFYENRVEAASSLFLELKSSKSTRDFMRLPDFFLAEIALRREKNLEKAIELYSRFLKESPEIPHYSNRARHMLGHALAEMGRIEEAKRLAREIDVHAKRLIYEKHIRFVATRPR